MSTPTEAEQETARTPAEAQRHFLNYFEASVREVVTAIYPKRYSYYFAGDEQHWEIEYQAWAHATQFEDTLADIDEGEKCTYRKMFAEAVMGAVKMKMDRKDIV